MIYQCLSQREKLVFGAYTGLIMCFNFDTWMKAWGVQFRFAGHRDLLARANFFGAVIEIISYRELFLKSTSRTTWGGSNVVRQTWNKKKSVEGEYSTQNCLSMPRNGFDVVHACEGDVVVSYAVCEIHLTADYLGRAATRSWIETERLNRWSSLKPNRLASQHRLHGSRGTVHSD